MYFYVLFYAHGNFKCQILSEPRSPRKEEEYQRMRKFGITFMNVGYERGCEGKEIFAKSEAAKAVQKLKKEYEDKIKGEGSLNFQNLRYVPDTEKFSEVR